MPFCKEEFEILKRYIGRREETFFTLLILIYVNAPCYLYGFVLGGQMIKNKTIRMCLLIILTPLLALIMSMESGYISIHYCIALCLILFLAYINLPKIDLRHVIVALILVVIIDCVMQNNYYALLDYKSYNSKTITIFFIFMILLGISYTGKTWIYKLFCNLILAIGLTNFFVLSITNKAFRLSDIRLLGTAMGVMKGVQFPKEQIPVLIVSIIAMILFNILICKIHLEFIKNTKRIIICLLIAFISIFNIRMNAPNYLQYLGNIKYGVLINIIIEDTGYTIPFESEFDLKISDNNTNNKESTFDTLAMEKKPNVIVILSEAFSDFNTYKDFPVDAEYIPYTKQLVKSCGGYTYSSVFGNNTVSTEFSVLTGIPTGLTTSGAVIYDEIKPMPSLVSLFHDKGYKTIGIHPYIADGYNRKKAWETFGFDKIIFDEEFQNVDNPYHLQFTPDKVLFEKVLDEISDDVPTFTFVITMQTHATYDYSMVQNIHVKDYHENELDNYLSLENYTDDALKMLIEKLNEKDRDTYILYFGDHQPLLGFKDYEYLMDIKSIQELDEEKNRQTFEVPYFIWTNAEKNYTVPQETSMNYLPGIFLEILGIHDPWYQYTQNISKRFPVITDQFFKLEDEWSVGKTPKNAIKEVHNDGSDLSKLKQYQVYSKNRINSGLPETEEKVEEKAKQEG